MVRGTRCPTSNLPALVSRLRGSAPPHQLNVFAIVNLVI